MRDVERIGHRWRLLVILAAIVLIVAAACSDGNDDTSFERVSRSIDDDSAVATGDDGAADDSAAFDEFAEPEPEPEPEPESEPQAGGGGGADDGAGDDGGDDGGPVQQGDALADLGRSIIFVATVEVEVDDVAFAASQAKSQIAGLGGLVFGESTKVGKKTTTRLEFKVPPGDFQEALRRLEGIGQLKSQEITADDVTERVVDLQSRIETAQVSVLRLRGFLEEATALEDIAELERELLRRETDLETLRGQLRTIQDQVDLATIFLTLRETAPPEVEPLGEFAVTFSDGADGGARCPGTDELRIDEGDQLTVCVQVTNTGSNAMGEIEIRDTRLDLDPRDFTFIDGADQQPLLPGESLVAFASLEAPARGSSRVVVSADALDDAGNPLRIGIEFFQPEDAIVEFVEDDSLPGFVDAVEASWGVVVTLVGVAVILAGVALPFLWLPLIGGVGYWWWQRRQDAEATADQPAA